MSVKLEIVYLDPNALVPNSWNTNCMTPENEEKLKNSIIRFGFTKPIIVRTLDSGEFQILGGEHRWSVAKSIGYTEVPIINLGSITDKKAKEIGLVDNGRYGEDDTLALAELLKEIGDADEILGFLPYSGDELESIFSSSSIALDDLDIDEDDSLPSIPSAKVAQTHVIMRFKIPVEDADYVQRTIESTMKIQDYTKDDSMINAGNAIVHLLRAL